MADKHEIELFINDEGELKVHIKGIKGPGCMKVLDSLARETGTLQDKQLSPEYYEQETKKSKPNNYERNS